LPNSVWDPRHLSRRSLAQRPQALALDDQALLHQMLDHVHHEQRIAIRTPINERRQGARDRPAAASIHIGRDIRGGEELQG
jgi:hypothetical protein